MLKVNVGKPGKAIYRVIRGLPVLCLNLGFLDPHKHSVIIFCKGKVSFHELIQREFLRLITKGGFLNLDFCRRTLPRTFLKCFALEPSVLKTKQLRNFLGRILGQKN